MGRVFRLQATGTVVTQPISLALPGEMAYYNDISYIIPRPTPQRPKIGILFPGVFCIELVPQCVAPFLTNSHANFANSDVSHAVLVIAQRYMYIWTSKELLVYIRKAHQCPGSLALVALAVSHRQPTKLRHIFPTASELCVILMGTCFVVEHDTCITDVTSMQIFTCSSCIHACRLWISHIQTLFLCPRLCRFS